MATNVRYRRRTQHLSVFHCRHAVNGGVCSNQFVRQMKDENRARIRQCNLMLVAVLDSVILNYGWWQIKMQEGCYI